MYTSSLRYTLAGGIYPAGEVYISSRRNVKSARALVHNHTDCFCTQASRTMKPNKPALRIVRLLDQVRERIRYLHYSMSTEKLYVYWARFLSGSVYSTHYV